MDWLDALKQEMLELTRTAALAYFPAINGYTEPYYNLRYEHVKQAEIEALKLLDAYPEADREVVLAAVWTHDRCKPCLSGHDHGNKAADWVAKHLAGKGFPPEKVKAGEYAVRNHAGWQREPLDTLEAKILWEAGAMPRAIKYPITAPARFFRCFLS